MWQSPDGDIIDCVPSHLQPAFDHPKLKGQKILVTLTTASFYLPFTYKFTCYVKTIFLFIQDPPERPKNYNFTITGSGSGSSDDVVVQAWHATGEACPEGTVPIRRTMEKDLLRASSLRRYGRKPVRRGVRRDSTSSGHEVCWSYKPCYPLPYRKIGKELIILCNVFFLTDGIVAIT